ncbi:unnamed protein product [Mytilus coruscus]|uniref:Uncharacterized protein n=1 Tax=Mytilus coruscus TaxID=42192 RepID=A0A6J8BFD6_MYTCO|nr:unnamed protein product [Mytilus coruscus]
MHEEEFGMPARWNYLESGHGKGPCDGLGQVSREQLKNAVNKDTGGVVETESLEQEGETVEDRNLEEEVEMNRQETVALDKLSKDTWVAAMYERKWYIGQVVDIDENDKEVQVKFMTETGRYGESFKWPKEDDIIWIKLDNILCIILSPPNPSGKRIKTYTISVDELKKIEDLAKTRN